MAEAVDSSVVVTVAPALHTLCAVPLSTVVEPLTLAPRTGALTYL